MVASNRSSTGTLYVIKRVSIVRHRFNATIAAACVASLSAAGCISHTVAGNPTTAGPTTTS